MATLQDLAKRMEAAAKELPDKVNEVSKKVATGITEYLATETPVDTSRALSNWQVGLGGPVRYEIEPHFPGFNGYTASPSSKQTILEAVAELDKKKPGETVYISNNVDYIEELNLGKSPQADPGFATTVAIEVGTAILDREAERFKL